MPRTSYRWLLAALLLAGAWPGESFVRVRHPDNGNVLRRTDARNIPFLINERTAAGLANSGGQPIIAAGSDPLGAIRAAMDTWTAVASSTVAFQAPGSTSATTFDRNGEHIISFVDTAQNRTLVGDALAVTVITFTSNGDIADTDILFSPIRTFSTNNLPNTFDLQSVAIHELGHALGAGHSGILAATMFQAIRPNSSLPARLVADDIAFVTSAYPEPGLETSLGSLSGMVRFLDGRPLFGALMVAADPNTGVAIGSISGPDGSYELTALPPGFYYLYAEPADGPVNVADLPSFYGGADDVFRTAFLGGPERMFPFQVTAGVNPAVNLVVVDEPQRHNIDFIATAAVGSSDLSNATQGPLAVRAGEAVDFVIAGIGLDGDIPDSNLLMIGAGVTIRPGSIRRTDVINGRASIRMTIQVAATAPFGVATIVIKGGDAASALSGALRILGGGGSGGPGPAPTPFLTLTPSSLTFTAPAASQTVQVDGTPGLRWTAAVATTSGGNWLLINPTTGVVPGTIEVFAIPGELPPGTYAGRITVSAAGASPQTVEVTLIIAAPPAPLILTGGVVNAASFVGGGVAPGEIVTILGRDMGPRAGVSASLSAGRLPLRLSDVTVYFSGLAAPLFFAAYDQINVQVPYEAASFQAVEMEVEYQGRRSPKVALRVLEAKPAIFTYGVKPTEPDFPPLNAAALNEDNTRNMPSNPALVGSIVQLFLTGQGVVSPPVATGEAAPIASPAPAPPRLVRVTISGVEAAVVFTGLTPGSVGVFQVNARVPEGLSPRDNAPVIVSVGAFESQTNVTLAVR